MKYGLDQVIHYMRDNRPHSAPVLARMQVDNLHDDFASTPEQKAIFTPFGPSRAVYATCHGLVLEDDAHPSKASLLLRIGA